MLQRCGVVWVFAFLVESLASPLTPSPPPSAPTLNLDTAVNPQTSTLTLTPNPALSSRPLWSRWPCCPFVVEVVRHGQGWAASLPCTASWLQVAATAASTCT